MSPAIEYSLVTETHDLHALENEWNSLYAKSGSSNIYLSWDWLTSWWEVYGKQRKLMVLLARDQNELIGVVPLLLRNFKYFGTISVRRIEFLSTGELVSETVCPAFMSMLLNSGNPRALVDGFVEFLLNELGSEWDEVFLSPMLSCDSVTDLVREKSKSIVGYKIETEVVGINAYTELSEDFETLLSSMGSKTRKKLRAGERSVEQDPNIKYSFLPRGGNFDWYFDEFVKLHNHRWEQAGPFSNHRYLIFQKNVCKKLHASENLMLSLLEIDGRIIAGNLDYCSNGIVYGYLTAFDPDYKSKMSWGFISMGLCLKHCVNKAFKIYDWYRIRESFTYKRHFSIIQRDVISVRLYKKGARSYCIDSLRFTVNILRKIKRRLIK